MALELSAPIAAFGGGDAEVVYDSTGPFEPVQTTTPVAVANFTMPRAGSIIATMWFSRGSSTTANLIRGLAVEVGDSRVDARLTNSARTLILSCYGDLPAGAATILVNSGSNSSTSRTTPTRIRVITWRS